MMHPREEPLANRLPPPSTKLPRQRLVLPLEVAADEVFNRSPGGEKLRR